jgi:hypothetical protein
LWSVTTEAKPLYAMLLTGGRSSRFPGDKLRAQLGGRPLVEWVASAILRAGISAFEIGPGYTSLPRIGGTERRNPLAEKPYGGSLSIPGLPNIIVADIFRNTLRLVLRVFV